MRTALYCHACSCAAETAGSSTNALPRQYRQLHSALQFFSFQLVKLWTVPQLLQGPLQAELARVFRRARYRLRRLDSKAYMVATPTILASKSAMTATSAGPTHARITGMIRPSSPHRSSGHAVSRVQLQQHAFKLSRRHNKAFLPVLCDSRVCGRASTCESRSSKWARCCSVCRSFTDFILLIDTCVCQEYAPSSPLLLFALILRRSHGTQADLAAHSECSHCLSSLSARTRFTLSRAHALLDQAQVIARVDLRSVRSI